MKRFVVWLLGVVLVAAAIGFLLRETIALRLMRTVVARNLAGSLLDELPDGLHLALCGAGSPLPDPQRSGACAAVIAGDRLYVVDAGSGASRNLARMRIPQGEIDGVLLTHFHSDHIDGLGELLLQRWVNGGSDEPTPVHGPAGVEEVVEGFARAYRQDSGYRTAHHGAAVLPPSGAGAVARPFPEPRDGVAVTLVEVDGLRITAFRVDHSPVAPAVGYRFDYGGRSLLISGDTAESANLAAFAKGVDLLVHEGLAPQLVAILTQGAESAKRPRVAKITRDILDYHTTPVEAAEIARDAGVGTLLFTHVVPPLPLAPLEDAFLEGVSQVYPGPVVVGRDGTFVSIPVEGDAILVRQEL